MGDPALVFWTGVLAVGTWGLAGVSWWYDRQQIDAQRDAANRQIAAQQEAERVRLTVSRRDRYESEEVQRYRRALAGQLRSLAPGETLSHFDPAIPNFFDVTGSLLRKGHLARDLIDNFFGYAARRYWCALKPTLDRDRDRNPNDNLWRDFRYLIEELGGRLPTEDEMRRFWEEEPSRGRCDRPTRRGSSGRMKSAKSWHAQLLA